MATSTSEAAELVRDAIGLAQKLIVRDRLLTPQSRERLVELASRLDSIARERRFDALLEQLRSLDEPLALVDESAARRDRLANIRESLGRALFLASDDDRLREIGSVVERLETLVDDALDELDERDQSAFTHNYGDDERATVERANQLILRIFRLRDPTFGAIIDELGDERLALPALVLDDDAEGQRAMTSAAIELERSRLERLGDFNRLIALLRSLLRARSSNANDDERAAKRPRVGCALCASEATYTCGGCKGAFYCSSECQRRHWNAAHRLACSTRETSRS